MKGIFPADIDADVGVFTDYFARGQVRTNLAHIQCKQVETRPEAIMSLDILTYALGDSHALNIECFDLKLCTFTRASDRVLQGAQMWCQVGNKDQRLVFSPITLDTNPHRASYLYWDLDRTGQLPATPDPHHLFYVSIPGPGLPYMMHEIYTEEYFIRTWYQEQYEPQFWAVRHRMPTMIENAYWNQDDQRVRFCTHYEEAFWAYPQGWIFGSGEISHGGLPSGNGVVYGSHESQAKFLTPQWLTKVTSPVEWCQASLFLESKS